MKRSHLKNRYLNNPTTINERNFNAIIVRLFKKEKKRYYDSLDTNNFSDNKLFWKNIKPLFSDKQLHHNKISLVENEKIIAKDGDIAETFNTYFSNIVKELGIEEDGIEIGNHSIDNISRVISKYKNHPSILKIKENTIRGDKFTFDILQENDIFSKLQSLNKEKPTTFNNIPASILVDTSDITAPYITKYLNNSIIECKFPSPLKNADITPAHKKDDRTDKSNYRPISILPSMSKVFERSMYDQIDKYMNKYLSPFLCGFRKGFSTQHCLMAMLERWKTALDKNKIAGALLTDLSKAFDCLNHDLLIAKLDAYGFDLPSLKLIFDYLSGRKQRTKINGKLSSWAEIFSGVPQGSILGPLLFNIYINDIFYFVENDMANYADDNTPYAIEKNSIYFLGTLSVKL